MASSSLTIPINPQAWIEEARNRNLETESLFTGGDFRSGSAITDVQFYLLRCIWPREQPAAGFNNIKESATGETATKELSKIEHWKDYLGTVGKTYRPNEFPHVGSFGLVRYYQNLIYSIEGHEQSDTSNIFRSKLRQTPRARPRYQTPQVYTSGRRSETPFAMADTPSRPPRRPVELLAQTFNKIRITPRNKNSQPSTPPPLNRGKGPATSPTGSRRRSDQTDRSSSSAQSVESSHSDWLESSLPVVEDEQIVNTALLLLLNSLTIHVPKVKGDWSLYRQPFQIQDREHTKIFEARVDGLLRNRADREVRAIIEVKPFVRSAKLSMICAQESAQMATWIATRAPPATKGLEKTYQRFLVSQDRHEVWITVATFSDVYVSYIKNMHNLSVQDNRQEAFLKMQTYGPFDTTMAADVAELGSALLYISLKECSSAGSIQSFKSVSKD